MVAQGAVAQPVAVIPVMLKFIDWVSKQVPEFIKKVKKNNILLLENKRCYDKIVHKQT